MKKALAILLVYSILMTLLVISPFTANADEKGISETGAKSGKTGQCTWTLDNGVLTISGNGYMDSYFKYEYDPPWLDPWQESGITKVVIKDGVTNIGWEAFNGCSALTSVFIPDSVTSIGEGAFYGCTGLTSVHISNIDSWCSIDFYSNPLYYAHNLFLNDTLITDLVISDSFTSIGSSVFSGCTALTSVTIPDSVTSIGKSAFSGCTGLTSVNIPESVTSIGNYAFSGCTGLTSVNIPESVTSIGDKAFSDCAGLTSVNIPDSVTSIGGGAFSGCSNLKTAYINQVAANRFTSIFDAQKCAVEDVTVSADVTSIGSSSFSGCENLKSVTIPDSVEIIGSSAFYDCINLKSITIPSTVTDIFEKAFGYYHRDGFGESKVKGFTVYGYINSEAQRYANDNNFIFVALDEEQSDPTKTTDRDIFGDIDGDGDITVIDSSFLQRYATRLYTPYPIGKAIEK